MRNMPTSKEIKQLVDRRHPESEDAISHWDFLEPCEKGNREWFEDHIFKYIKEGDDEYKNRVERAYRFNHSREIVDLGNKYLFKKKVIRNVADAPRHIQDFWARATREGRPIEEFMPQVSRKSSNRGRSWIVVKSNMSEPVETKAEEKKDDSRVYS